LESLKHKEYSKASDMFSVAATIYEWDVHRPFIAAMDGVNKDLPFYINIHEEGRPIEQYDTDSHEWQLVPDGKGGYERETLTPGRTSRSIFASVLDSICNVDPRKRLSAVEVMTCLKMNPNAPQVCDLEVNGKPLQSLSLTL
jgi:serine/threonine protein kinase